MTTATPTAKQRAAFVKSGAAMPDGSFYINDGGDLQNAINAVGRAKPTSDESEVARRNAVRRHIITRASALKLQSKIPDSWNSDGSLKHSGAEEFIAHFGRRGMKWGEHVFGGGRGGESGPVHPDVARARAAQEIIRTHGLKAVSNDQLRDLNKRTQLETDHARLNSPHQSEGQKIVQQIVREQSKAIASAYVAKHAPQGIEYLVKKGIKVAVGSGRHTKY